MSRYPIAHPDSHCTVVVGWDNPLQTFFGQVFDDRQPEDETCVLNVGIEEYALTSPGALAQAMQPWVVLATNVLTQLQADQDTSPPRTALQEAWLAYARRSR